MSNLALYLHIPFCRRKCAYCDFSSWADREGQIEAYLRALHAEIQAQGARFASGRMVSSVFFGGGTPSLLSGEQMKRLMDALRGRFSFRADVEITMEGNPGTLTEANLDDYRAAGVNRLSLGVQALDDELLRGIGRIHTTAQAEEAVRMARRVGFDNLNLDLMYGLPGQDEARFAQTVEQALALDVEHLSMYSLILEEGTPLFEQVQAGKCALPDDEQVLSMQHAAQDRLEAAGYLRYEISNYAKAGRACRHNLSYWRRDEYLGLGCAAHSLMDNTRFANTASLDAYLRGERTVEQEALTAVDAFEETVMLGLRTREGIAREVLSGHEQALKQLVQGGLLREEGDRVHVTRQGADLLNAVILKLIE